LAKCYDLLGIFAVQYWTVCQSKTLALRSNPARILPCKFIQARRFYRPKDDFMMPTDTGGGSGMILLIATLTGDGPIATAGSRPESSLLGQVKAAMPA